MIRVEIGVLADQTHEGVLRPVRTDLTPVSAAGRDIAARAGEAMTARLLGMGSVPMGGAVITPAGQLPSSYVIHAVVSSDEEPETIESARRALRNGLRRAADVGLASLALPPLGMGVGILEADDSARAMVEILLDHLDEGRAPLDLTIVVSSDYEASVFARLVTELARQRFPMQN
jgi:O-acetyl-ADP-ribose deacetylase (regulator of RNase III)